MATDLTELKGWVLVWKNGEVYYYERGIIPVFTTKERAIDIRTNIPTAYGCSIERISNVKMEMDNKFPIIFGMGIYLLLLVSLLVIVAGYYTRYGI